MLQWALLKLGAPPASGDDALGLPHRLLLREPAMVWPITLLAEIVLVEVSVSVPVPVPGELPIPERSPSA
jgi:hypothetical protein